MIAQYEVDLIEVGLADMRREIDREVVRQLHPDPPGWSAIRRGPGWDLSGASRRPRSTIGQ